MRLSWILSIIQNIVKVHYNKDIKLNSENLIDIALKISGCVGKAKEYHLVLEVAISGTKGHLSLITFSDSLPMVDTSEIQLGKPLGPA